MRAIYCLNSITIVQLAIDNAPNNKEICIRTFLNYRGIRNNAMDSKLGREAKRLYLLDNPDFVFPKKDICCNGQMVQTNIWKESQTDYLQQTLQHITV